MVIEYTALNIKSQCDIQYSLFKQIIMSDPSNEELDQYFDVALDLVKKAGTMVNEAIRSRSKKGKEENRES